MGGFKNHLEKLNNHSGHIFGMEETKDQGFDPFLNDEMVPEDDSQSFWDRSIHPKAIPFPSIPITVG
jgi:hypothetical protein